MVCFSQQKILSTHPVLPGNSYGTLFCTIVSTLRQRFSVLSDTNVGHLFSCQQGSATLARADSTILNTSDMKKLVRAKLCYWTRSLVVSFGNPREKPTESASHPTSASRPKTPHKLRTPPLPLHCKIDPTIDAVDGARKTICVTPPSKSGPPLLPLTSCWCPLFLPLPPTCLPCPCQQARRSLLPDGLAPPSRGDALAPVLISQNTSQDMTKERGWNYITQDSSQATAQSNDRLAQGVSFRKKQPATLTQKSSNISRGALEKVSCAKCFEIAIKAVVSTE